MQKWVHWNRHWIKCSVNDPTHELREREKSEANLSGGEEERSEKIAPPNRIAPICKLKFLFYQQNLYAFHLLYKEYLS